jgi:alkylhydroperoxidase/carboxymuconolactone decarboxylase family protein YurZ
MGMQNLTTIATDSELARLRAAYTSESLLAANAGAFAEVYPRFAPWGETIGRLCFETSQLAARDRELALISLLAHRSPGLSMSNHIYWGLMEGVTVVQICEVVALVGCYCGLPTYTQGVLTLGRTLQTLKRIAAEDDRTSTRVLAALVAEFANERL